ncbi:MAG: helix-turn-helix transcriptional regulator [Clostridia bacterium]|nr:helix-turn-helix transcriptional regulator [Clostridia bacterium]
MFFYTFNRLYSFYISRNYLSAFFKKNMGITLNAYLRKIRLSNAAMQLVSTNKNVTEISLDSGFKSITTFLREFKKEYGTSPSDMRRIAEKN